MNDAGALLHNMSGPPHTVVKYSGLADLAVLHSPGGSGVSGIGFKNSGVFGTPVRFALPAGFSGQSPSEILRRLGIEPGEDAAEQLAALIDRRANELPLPEGCAAIGASESHRILWPDALSALAVLAKSSDSIWLRAKHPALNAALARSAISLLVPPQFAIHLPEVLP